MTRRPPRSTRTATLLPYTTLVRSPRTPAPKAEPVDTHARSTDTGGASGVMPATPAPRRLHRLVVARRNPPCRGLSLGLGIERPTPAGLLARGSGLDARLPRLSQWLSGSKSGRCIALAAYKIGRAHV